MKIGRKVPLVRQLAITDCGAACLAMIFQYYGKVNINDIKRKLDTGRDGLSLMDMKKVSETFGFQFTAYEDYVDEENIIMDLCQYFGQKKSKDYAAFFSSSSSFCCGVK